MHGFINLNKPLGLSSAQAVERVKKILRSSLRAEGEAIQPGLPRRSAPRNDIKIGHAGTLDPLASGVLVLALGEATKLVNYAQDAQKAYEFTATWGEARDTDDAEGAVVATSDKRPAQAEIEAILPQFTGEIMQAPPAFSAIKMGGKRAYAMARAGEAPEMQARPVRVDRLQVTGDRGQKDSHATSFFIECGKGTYIRSLARDMGQQLGVYGYVSMLRRVGVGKFGISDAISLDKLEEMVHKGDLGFLKPPQWVLDDILAFTLNEAEAGMLKRGQAIEKHPALASDQIVACVLGGTLIAVGRTDARFLKPERVFNL
ncbi:MAG: tRNA pseudouridine(55) synthase TruB [Alphaproteobacteria bacterium]|nr:tRNA pseudouridine(55) synthase TruB [Alphaproteobacteria bacterium]